MKNSLTVEALRPRIADWLTDPIRRNRLVYLKVAAAAVMINLFALATSLFAMVVYDRVLPNNATASLVGLSIGLAIVILFDFALKTLRAYFVDIAGADIDSRIGAKVFRRILAMGLERQRGSTGSLAGLVRELESLREFFASATLIAIVDVPFIILTLALIALIGGSLVLVPLACVPLVVLAGWLTRPALDRLSAKAMDEGFEKQAVLVEAIGGLETVKAVGAGGLLGARWQDAMERQGHSMLRQRLVAAISVNVAASGQTLSYAGVVIAGVGMIGAGTLSMGALIACSMLAGRAVAPLGQIANLLSRLTTTRAAYRQLDALMRTDETESGERIRLTGFEAAIELRDVHFRYPGASVNALRGLSLRIRPGERVALVGRVGSGKSTVARLLLGLYRPSDGLVMLDGNDLRQMDVAHLRSGIGAALQDSVLVSGSVRDNIVLGRGHIDQEEMLRVSRLSGAHDFLGKVANGYDLKLVDRGESLSGGQRQAISIARSLAGRPQLVILDEPTSAMDNQSEQALIDRLADELEGRTVLMITHRQPLLRLATRIIVMHEGRIVGDGPRDEVLRGLSQRREAA